MAEIPRFIQIHYLTTYPASLLNRDDAGFAKRLPFGAAVRTRISSQCLKRHWRTFDGQGALSSIRGPETMSVRSRYIFEQIARPLYEKYNQEHVNRTVKAVSDVVLGAAEKEAGESRQKSGSELRTNQLIVLGRAEIEYLTRLVDELLERAADAKVDKNGVKDRLGKEGLKNLAAIGRGAGLDAALFGRMKTSDVLADCDAAVHVAHAFTVHQEQSETDYFTAVDDLVRSLDEEAGAGAAHVNAAELTSGIYYGYVSVDVRLLISNLEGVPPEAWQKADISIAGEVLENLVYLVATVSPGAKRGSTAPYSYADFVATEAGSTQPCTWANAFFDPVRIAEGMREKAIHALSRHVERLDSVYKPGNKRRYVSLYDAGLLETSAKREVDIKALAGWVNRRVVEGIEEEVQ
ncbi:MAG: type I-E CRISPR-associated protein Cas7/Cse4/CasC [Deltaproteobacteria bacterium]|nr:type I-E CRISPR-associated protein Cas7/Cse4/CasC [Deltaproteobacteria bacterium]